MAHGLVDPPSGVAGETLAGAGIPALGGCYQTVFAARYQFGDGHFSVSVGRGGTEDPGYLHYQSAISGSELVPGSCRGRGDPLWVCSLNWQATPSQFRGQPASMAEPTEAVFAVGVERWGGGSLPGIRIRPLLRTFRHVVPPLPVLIVLGVLGV